MQILFPILRYNRWDLFSKYDRREKEIGKREFRDGSTKFTIRCELVSFEICDEWTPSWNFKGVSLSLSLSFFLFLYLSRTYPSSPLCMLSGVSWISMVKRSVTYSLRNRRRLRARTYVRTYLHTYVFHRRLSRFTWCTETAEFGESSGCSAARVKWCTRPGSLSWRERKSHDRDRWNTIWSEKRI